MSCGTCKKTAIKAAHGATGLAKAALGIGLAEAPFIIERRELCHACEFSTRNRIGFQKLIARCTKCSCIIAAKTRLKDEQCPEGKW